LRRAASGQAASRAATGPDRRDRQQCLGGPQVGRRRGGTAIGLAGGDPRDESPYVGIDDRVALAIRERRHGVCGVGADAGQARQHADVGRNDVAVPIGDHCGAGVQP